MQLSFGEFDCFSGRLPRSDAEPLQALMVRSKCTLKGPGQWACSKQATRQARMLGPCWPNALVKRVGKSHCWSKPPKPIRLLSKVESRRYKHMAAGGGGGETVQQLQDSSRIDCPAPYTGEEVKQAQREMVANKLAAFLGKSRVKTDDSRPA